MPVSFYTLVFIIILAFLVVLTPFLGFPHALEGGIVAVLGALILGTAFYALYKGYVRLIRLEERRASRRSVAADEDGTQKEDTKEVSLEEQDSNQPPRDKQSRINVVRDDF